MGKYSIILVMGVSLFMVYYSGAIRNNIYASEVEIVRNYHQNNARNIAQSAALVAVRKITDSNTDEFTVNADETKRIPSSDYKPWDELDGKYKYELINSGGNSLVLKTTGISGSKEYTVTVTMEKMPVDWNNIPYAIFAKEGITIDNAQVIGDIGTNATADASIQLGSLGLLEYDLNLEDLGSALGNLNINEALNEVIVPGCMICPDSDGDGGDVYVGPGGSDNTIKVNEDLLSNLISTVTGLVDGVLDWLFGSDEGGEFSPYKSWAALSIPETFEAPVLPNFPPKINKKEIDFGYINAATLSPEDYSGYYIPELTLDGINSLTIETGGEDRILHVGKLLVEGVSGSINIKGGGDLKVMVEDEMDLGGVLSGININGSPSQLEIYYAGDKEVNLGLLSTFKGSLVVKKADITINGLIDNFKGHIISGGENVTIGLLNSFLEPEEYEEGVHSSFTNLIYAPNAKVTFNSIITNFHGHIVAEEFEANSLLGLLTQFTQADPDPTTLPDLPENFVVKTWY